MTDDQDRLLGALRVLTDSGYECRRIDTFDGAAVADFRGPQPADVGLFMTHDALDHVRQVERVALLRGLVAEFRDDYERRGYTARMVDEHGISWPAHDLLTARADALEASAGQTATPTPPR